MSTVFSGSRPDITPVQWISFVAVLITSGAVIVGFNFSPEQLEAINNIKVAAIGLFAADTFLRVGRGFAASRVEAAAMAPDAGTASPPLEHGARDIPADEDPLPGAGGPLPSDEVELGGDAESGRAFPPDPR